jgi:hypothetical protein
MVIVLDILTLQWWTIYQLMHYTVAYLLKAKFRNQQGWPLLGKGSSNTSIARQ